MKNLKIICNTLITAGGFLLIGTAGYSDNNFIEIADLVLKAVDFIVEIGSRAEIGGAENERVIHGQTDISVSLNAASVARRFLHRLTQRDGDVFRRVMRVHVHVAFAFDGQVEPGMRGKQGQHVV